ncbi:MAG: hypothetical protein AAF387_00950 [Pseudomonadota bacterium]
MAVSQHELLERVNALLQAIAERTNEAEQNRQSHDETIQALVDAEVFQMLVPKSLGGHE